MSINKRIFSEIDSKNKCMFSHNQSSVHGKTLVDRWNIVIDFLNLKSEV